MTDGLVFARHIEADPARPLLVLLHGVPVTLSVYEPFARELAEALGQVGLASW